MSTSRAADRCDHPAPPSTWPGRRARRVARVLLAVWLVGLARVTLWPAPVDASGRSGLLAVLERLHERGVPTWLDFSFVERVANVVMFVPYGALLVVLLPVRRWWLAVVLPAATSVLVETAQHAFLPRRVASGWDVTTNTAGALLGAGLVVVVLLALRHRGGTAGERVVPATSAAPPASAPPSS